MMLKKLSMIKKVAHLDNIENIFHQYLPHLDLLSIAEMKYDSDCNYCRTKSEKFEAVYQSS